MANTGVRWNAAALPDVTRFAARMIAPDHGPPRSDSSPIFDNSGRRFPPGHYARVRSVLTARFGGLTAYSRAPAEGVWDGGDAVKREDIVVIEVMVDELERSWWQDYRLQLETLFRQDRIVVRAQIYEAL